MTSENEFYEEILYEDSSPEEILTWETRKEDDVLNPLCDPVFKSMFTKNTDEARSALKGFLSAIFNRNVTDIQLTTPELPKESYTDKDSKFDLSCLFEGESEYAEIEMQGRNENHAYDKRAEYYAAHLLNHNTREGDSWDKVPKVYQISVLNFVYDKDDENGFSWYTMRKNNGGILSDRMNIIFIELIKIIPPKIKELLKKQLRKPNINIDSELKTLVNNLTALEKWCIFLSYRRNKYFQNLIHIVTEQEEIIMNAEASLSRISKDEVEWVRQRAYYDYMSNMASAEYNGGKKRKDDGKD